MRTIKFRLRDINNKIVGYEKWYGGSYLKDEQRFDAMPCWLYSTDNEKWTSNFANYIPHRFKDQFTGLKDKNGKEIYRGDIIKDEKCDGLANGVVEFGKGTYDTGFYSYQGYYVKYPDVYFESGKYKRYENEFDTDGTGGILFDCEIIGNIFQNPELL